MSFLDDIYYQLCERFITKKDWQKHPYSSRHLQRKMNIYWPAYSAKKLGYN